MPATALDENTALVLIDLQKGLASFPAKPLPFSAVVDTAARLVQAFRAHNLPIVLVRVDVNRAESKRTWGAFHNTQLDQRLRERGVTGLVLGGIATSIGVESTARAASEHGYNLTIVSDAVTDFNPEAHHNSLTNIFPRIAEIDTAEAVLKLLG